MSSLLRTSSGTQNESLKIQIKTTKNNQIFSKSSQQEAVFDQDEFQDYRFLLLELLASWLSFSCLVLGKKITFFCCDCFSKTASESSYPSHSPSNSIKPESPSQIRDFDDENYSVSSNSIKSESPSQIRDFDVENYSVSSNSTKSESPSQILDFDVENYSVSLLNLDVEDSELIADFDHDLEFHDHTQSSFPSPSFKSSCALSTNSSESRSEIALETLEFEDLDTESEPLFWPLEKKFSWSSDQETWRCFTMSPRKEDEASQSSCDAFELRVEEREKPVFGLGSEASTIMERRLRNKAIATSIPSRLSISSKSGAKIAKFETETNEIPRDSKASDGLFPLNLACHILDGGLLEEEFKQEELSIELLLGLGEFDGHEGVDIEFNQYDFSLDDSLS